jgi:predicted transcriptional regulator
MITIRTFIKDLQSKGHNNAEIAQKLGLSPSMVSQYVNHDYNPTLETARAIYKQFGVHLYPFSKKALEDTNG